MRTSDAFNSQWLNIRAKDVEIDTRKTQAQVNTNTNEGPHKQTARENAQHTEVTAETNMEVCEIAMF